MPSPYTSCLTPRVQDVKNSNKGEDPCLQRCPVMEFWRESKSAAPESSLLDELDAECSLLYHTVIQAHGAHPPPPGPSTTRFSSDTPCRR